MKSKYKNRLITAVVALSLPATSVLASDWKVDADGWWGDYSNWTGGIPNSAGATANFTFDITADRTVSVDLNKTVGIVNIGDTSHKYTLTNDGSWKMIDMNNNGAGAEFNVLANSNVELSAATGLINLIADDALTVTVGVGGTLTFGNNSNFYVGSNALTLTGEGNIVTGTLGGSGTITKSGSGTVTLTGATSHTGTLNVAAGNWVVEGASEISSATVAGVLDLTNTSGSMKKLTSLTISSGGQVMLGSHGNSNVGDNAFATQQIGNANSDGLAASGAIFTAVTLDGTLTLANGNQSNLDIGPLSGASTGVLAMNGNDIGIWTDTNQSSTYAGVITGTSSAGVYKQGQGTLILSGASTAFSGDIIVVAGTLQVTNASALGNTTSGTEVFSGSTLQLSGGITTAESITLAGTGYNAGGALRNLSGGNTLGGAIILGNDSTISAAAGTLTVNSSGGFTGNNRALTVDAASGAEVVVDRSLSNLSGLTKTGAGTLTLSGANTYTGATAVDAGTLVLNGSTTSAITVGTAGTLMGSGSMTGNLLNHGAFRPGNSPGTFTVTGNFTNSSTGTFYVEIASLASYDQLQVTGTANLAGALNVTVDGAYAPTAAGDSFTLITTTGGVTGTFDTVTVSAAFSSSLVYNANTVVLEIYYNSYTNSALTPNQRAVAESLDTVRAASPTGDASTVITALNTLGAADLRAAFDQLGSGALEFNTAMHSNIVAINDATRVNLDGRFSRLRTGQTGATVGILSLRDQLANRLSFENLSLLASTADAPVAAARPAEPSRWGTFVSGTALLGDTETRGEEAGYNSSVETITTGLDYQLRTGLHAGAYLTYSHSEQDLGDGLGGTEARNIGAGLYAQWQDANGCYLNASAGTGWTDFKNHRVISVFSRSATGKPEGRDYFVSLSGGRDYTCGAWTYGPIASLTYTRATIDSYTETGAGFLDLNVSESELDTTRSTLGAKVAREFKLGSAYLVPQAMVAWQHDFEGSGQTLSAAFTESPVAARFAVRSTDIAADTLVTGLGAQCLLDAGTTLYAHYYADLFNPDYFAQGLTAGLQISF